MYTRLESNEKVTVGDETGVIYDNLANSDAVSVEVTADDVVMSGVCALCPMPDNASEYFGHGTIDGRIAFEIEVYSVAAGMGNGSSVVLTFDGIDEPSNVKLTPLYASHIGYENLPEGMFGDFSRVESDVARLNEAIPDGIYLNNEPVSIADALDAIVQAGSLSGLTFSDNYQETQQEI